MPLLATYTFAGAASMANGTNCFAHSLPTTPDWALAVPLVVGGAVAASSIPFHLVSRAAATVIFQNSNGGGVNAEVVAQFVHSIAR